MLIVISNPSPIENEANIINALFEGELEILHLRKPEATEGEIRRILDGINASYHPKIALYNHHQIANEYGLKRLHFTEAKRQETLEEKLIELTEAGFTLSTSVHSIAEYKELPSAFAFTFFSPVFNSISKSGYVSSIPEDFVFPVEVGKPKVIALGGIEASNVRQVVKMDFDGVAVLGAIWQEPKEALKQYNAIKKVWLGEKVE